MAESRFDLAMVFCGKIPVDGAPDTIGEGDLRLPAQEFPSQPVVRYPVQGTCRHIAEELDLGLPARVAQDFLHGVDDLDAFHSAQVDGCPIVDLLGCQDSAAHNIVDEGPVSNLLAVS